MRFAAFLVAALVLGGVAEAGPWRRPVTRTTSSVCTADGCGTTTERTRTVTRGGGAQAHAEAMAASGRMVHASSHPGFEGVGYGSTPEKAIASCCNNGGPVVDQGVAQGRDGRWYACRRYGR